MTLTPICEMDPTSSDGLVSGRPHGLTVSLSRRLELTLPGRSTANLLHWAFGCKRPFFKVLCLQHFCIARRAFMILGVIVHVGCISDLGDGITALDVLLQLGGLLEGPRGQVCLYNSVASSYSMILSHTVTRSMAFSASLPSKLVLQATVGHVLTSLLPSPETQVHPLSLG